ncbi:asparagine synthase-related protein [Formosa sp. PL04]|uniref:asparagine synthase-related protein n=1 Tax=Formosa sp. PL04 TaxID=3081755 RepID=UPI0029829299|nr:asparagine synthase-related protein [Formosa sp. PL04]MDW5290740.1 asparagine synthase-related protein [Formosa sp. PL04]
MKTITTPIIPLKQTFAKIEAEHVPNYEAICVFAAIGFFLDQDTYWKDEVVLKPGTTYVLDQDGGVKSEAAHFKWYYKPRDISFHTALEEFTSLFERIVKEQTGEGKVILPLSGGLDSRSQAVALKHLNADVHSYSYSFSGGFKEHKISEQIAQACDYKFDSFIIPPNYLWHVLDEAADINKCYSEYTHPRQMAVLYEFRKMEGTFSLGHWGDVLFDRGIAEKDALLSDVDLIFKKIIKKGGLELAQKLWRSWNLEGDFEMYLKTRLQTLLDGIAIDNKSARIRAFKSLYWAPRWTSVSLSFFDAVHPVNAPYYDDRMCRFICEIPEAYLADRKLQIAYIKKRNPKVAEIEWQDRMPFNLNNYKEPQPFKYLTYRVKNKLQRELNAFIGKKYVQRNWELQFLGKENANQLEHHLFNTSFNDFLGSDIARQMYAKFNTEDAVEYSHPVSMLLTLSLWHNKSK